LLFQGEEYGASTPFLYFTDHGDPELAAAVSKGRREEFASFGWKSDDIPDPQQESSFTSSKLDWNELGQPPHEELLDWHRSLISLRRSTPALQQGSLDHLSVEFSERDSWLSLYRQSVAVICNFSPLHRTIPVRLSGQPVLSSSPTFALKEQVVELPSESVLILIADPLACG
jgi:maltooligosyltrehalose trehalohydrolase